MASRQRQNNWQTRALTWTIALAFALAPALSLAFSVPVAAFSAPVVHAHDHGDTDHTHHGHQHDHDHGAHDAGHHHAIDINVDWPEDHSPGHHVHLDVCCPSVLAPPGIPEAVRHMVATRYDLVPVETLHGSPPKRLLRPPIIPASID